MVCKLQHNKIDVIKQFTNQINLIRMEKKKTTMPRHLEIEETQRERKKGSSEEFEEERILSTSKELWMIGDLN